MTRRSPRRLVRLGRFGRFAGAAAIALTLSLGTTGCGFDKIDWKAVVDKLKHPKKRRAKKSDDDDEPKDKAVDLGTATYPPSARSPARVHDFYAREIDPDEYELTYVLASEAATKAETDYQDFARKVHFLSMGSGRFRWVPPAGCPKDMGCVFSALGNEDKDALAPLVALFRERQRAAKLDTLELANLVVGFAQNIEYYLPEKEPFGVLAPALVVAQKHGDCDSKSLLAHLILEKLGFDTLMLSSMAHAHSMLGIAVPVSGTKFHFGGRDYAYTEMTAKGSPIGHINRELLTPNDWAAVPLKAPTAGFD